MTVQRQIRIKPMVRAGSRRRTSTFHALVTVGLLLVNYAFLAAQAPSEYQVKAAFLLNFTKFIEWPSEAFETADSPLSICILGDDPFGNALDQSVEGETVGSRKITVQRLPRAPAPKSCQVLFISKSEKGVPDLLASLGTGVLTVSDRDGFLREGGIISLVIENRHVRFDVSQRAATKALLTMSARMLNVARIVLK